VGRRKSNGLAGPGSLVRYGDEVKNCSAVKMQFDAGSARLAPQLERQVDVVVRFLRQGREVILL
jgi:hypothetical protein